MRIYLLFICVFCGTIAFSQPTKSESSELKQLATSIGERSVVALGEIGHGYETINAAKSMTLDFLRSRLNFEAVVFESSFTEGMISYLRNDAFEKRLKSFLYPFWNTASVRASLRLTFALEQQKQERLPLITGCDVQEDCRFTSLSEYLFKEGYGGIANKRALTICDSILSLYIGRKPARKGAISKNEYDILVSNYNVVAEELNRRDMQDVPKKILLRCIENRKWLCEYLTIADINERMSYRDSIMYQNVIWIKDELLTGKKLVIWSTDTHIARAGKTRFAWMGERLSAALKNDYYTISFRRVIGLPANRFDSIFNLKKLEKIKSSEWITPCD
jgi:erythromycin esterase